MRIPLSQLRFPATAGHDGASTRAAWSIARTRARGSPSCPRTRAASPRAWPPSRAWTGSFPAGTWSSCPTSRAVPSTSRPRGRAIPGTTARSSSEGPVSTSSTASSSGMALVGAVNPDFGQVEVDPAVVNLSAFETFFEEKRPFFTEGSQVFLRFGRSGASDYTTFFYPEPQLFYSRRIGRAPQGVASGDFVDAPSSTTILGAAKLVGRTRSGWSLGLLEAVTGREQRPGASRPFARPRGGGAAHELLRGPRPARAGLPRVPRLPRHRGPPRPRHRRPLRPARGPGLRGRGRRPRLPGREARLGASRAGFPGAASRGARPRCCACSDPRCGTTSVRTPPT